MIIILKTVTEEIVNTFKDTRIKYFSTDTKYNLGKGISCKKGKKLLDYLFDSDDLWLSNKLYDC